MRLSSIPAAKAATVVLTGNPNCGKTTLFNALTGMRAKVGNYPGVTVERKEGRLTGSPAGGPVTVVDLPGSYSLNPQSPDEEIARDVLLGHLPEGPFPTLAIIVVDASNLERHLYYVTQVIELGYPTILALNMTDLAVAGGKLNDPAVLAGRLGVPVVPLIASTGQGLPELRREIARLVAQTAGPDKRSFCQLPPIFRDEVSLLAQQLERQGAQTQPRAQAEALLVLSDERILAGNANGYSLEFLAQVAAARIRLGAAGVAWSRVAIESRYARVQDILRAVTTETAVPQETSSDRWDRVLTHKTWGLLIFLGLMALMFQCIFSLAKWPMKLIEAVIAHLGDFTGHLIPPGYLHSLIQDGVIAGVGAVVVFLPQICLLFLFIGLLEDSGYMARAAFLMDRLMSKVGLHGKSFIPMLSSFACAIPGIMATRTIERPKDRLVTILVAPLMSCSARLPVYTMVIAACIPDQRILGPIRLPGLILVAMYFLGVAMALAMAWFFKKTLLKGESPILILELPPYRRPAVSVLAAYVGERSVLFLKKAGTIILGINILLWFLVTYPKDTAQEQEYASRRAALTRDATSPGLSPPAPTPDPAALLAELDRTETGERLRRSFAGRLGRLIEPAIAPLGMDWKIGIGLVTSFAAREVFVSTMSTVYSVGSADSMDSNPQGLARTMREQKRPDGSPLYTPLMGLTLMVFYVLAMQCVSTMAVVQRETNSWKWPLFQWLYMGALAWTFAFLVYQGGRLLGWR